MSAFAFKLEHEDGTPADPPTLQAARPDWKAGDSMYFGRKTLGVVAVRDEDAAQPPTLVVRDRAESASGDAA
jgi:hypothetical protein